MRTKPTRRVRGWMAVVLAGTPFLALRATAASAPPPIQHVIMIMQENRSFDNYFGTFPNANGIPAGACLPYEVAHPQQGCVQPFHDPHDTNAGSGHRALDAQIDIDNGVNSAAMNGFVQDQNTGLRNLNCKGSSEQQAMCALVLDGLLRHDAMGYHTDAEIPNYWAYAKNFVLQDNFFESVRGWSGASHLQLVSEWSAACSNPGNVATCVSTTATPQPKPTSVYPWVALFQLLDKYGISWKYYIAKGTEPDCQDDEGTCAPVLTQAPQVSGLWNPAPGFAWVKAQGKAYIKQHNPSIDQFLLDAASNTLPQVAWLVPNAEISEHPPGGITAGMEYVTAAVNAVMQSPAWWSSVIFISWDDWGGFYDHVVPPDIDYNATSTPVQGYGIRVPGIAISPWVKAGTIDHQLLSFDSYATLIEDLFAQSTRLVPAAFGQPDARPTIRDALVNTTASFPNGQTERIGDLIKEFNFTQAPLPPLILSTHIPVNLLASCGVDVGARCTQSSVTLTWHPVGTAAEAENFTYHIQRDGSDIGQCTGTSTTCTDRPGSGVHLYRAYSVDLNGAVSPLSAAAEADIP